MSILQSIYNSQYSPEKTRKNSASPTVHLRTTREPNSSHPTPREIQRV